MFDGVPGAALAAEVEAADPAGLADEALLDLAAAAQRLEAWAASVRLDAAAAFTDRRPPSQHEVTSDQGPGGCSGFAADELAAALSCHRGAAEVAMHQGLTLRDDLPRSAALLRAGWITAYQAGLVIDQAMLLDPAGCAGLEDEFEGRLPRRTNGEVRRLLGHAVQVVDPAAAVRRRVRAVSDRCVRFTPHPDCGMSSMSAWLPAAAAEVLCTRLTGLAKAASSPGDSRTLDQRRADMLIELVAGAGNSRSTRCGDAVAAAGGARSADERVHAQDAVMIGAADGSAGPTDIEIPVGGAVEIQVVVSASTLLSLDQLPAEILGYGPIDAALARRLARGQHATWRRLLTDPMSGTVLDVGTTRYAPPAALDQHVRTRDGTCRFPHCRQPARRCDLDHTIRHPDGPTADHNLSALCRHHHRLKHETAWQLEQPSPGTLVWTSPTGRVHRVPPPRS